MAETKELSPKGENKKEPEKVSDVSKEEENEKTVFSIELMVPRAVCPDGKSTSKEQQAQLDALCSETLKKAKEIMGVKDKK